MTVFFSGRGKNFVTIIPKKVLRPTYLHIQCILFTVSCKLKQTEFEADYSFPLWDLRGWEYEDYNNFWGVWQYVVWYAVANVSEECDTCLDFKLLPCSLCSMFSFGVFPRRLRFKSRRFGTLYQFHLPRQGSRKMAPIEGSETSDFKPQTPGKYPKENILHKEHGESLKSRHHFMCLPKHIIKPRRWYSRGMSHTLEKWEIWTELW